MSDPLGWILDSNILKNSNLTTDVLKYNIRSNCWRSKIQHLNQPKVGLKIGTKLPFALFGQINQAFALFPKLNREMPLF